MRFDRNKFFTSVRTSLFAGSLTQQQVDGLNFKLSEWETHYPDGDLRHLAYALATSKHETASTMWPVEENGKGAGMSYGKPDPVTGKTYYGRGDVQLTWKENYERATKELGLTGTRDLVWYPDMALDPAISADVMYRGMLYGWFRSDSKGKQTLARYFNSSTNDAYGAREIINGDRTKVPKRSNGVSIGKLIAGYHQKFLVALELSAISDTKPIEPEPPAPLTGSIKLTITQEVIVPRDGSPSSAKIVSVVQTEID